MDTKELKEAATEIYRVRDKIENIDDHSKLFKKYCQVSMILMAVVIIVALCTQIFGVAIVAGCLLLIIALLFWANSREYKKVRFAVSRNLPIMLGMVQIFVIIALIGSIFLKIKMAM